MKNKNFVIAFISGLSEQISKIETPVINGFLKQIITVFGITLFFSLFFSCISFGWLKLMVLIYNIGS